jgi:hypothetical protein
MKPEILNIQKLGEWAHPNKRNAKLTAHLPSGADVEVSVSHERLLKLLADETIRGNPPCKRLFNRMVDQMDLHWEHPAYLRGQDAHHADRFFSEYEEMFYYDSDPESR